MKKNLTVLKLLLSGAAFFIFLYSSIAQGPWVQKADFGGISRNFAVGFSIGTKGYIGTGYDGTINQKDFWEWDQATNVWTQKADFGGTARQGAVGFSIGTKGYIGTGNNQKDFWEWDQATNVWSPKTIFGGAGRSYAVGFSIGTRGYIGTGVDAGNTLKKDFWEWDQSSNIWTQKADFSGSARRWALGFSIGTKGYIGTGWGTPFPLFKQDFWEWDQVTNIWTQKANFAGSSRGAAVGFSIGSKGYIGTGYEGAGIYKQDFWEYDITNNSWMQKTNFGGAARWSAVGFSIGSKGYIGVGFNGGSPGYMKDFWEWNPLCDYLINITQSNTSCNGGSDGSATASPTGGVAPFSYIWSNGQTSATAVNLSAGNYTVTVTDANGCSNTASVTIVQSVPPSVSAFISGTISCDGACNGSLSASAVGGTPPYFYSWSGGYFGSTANNVCAGTYNVTVEDSKGCTATTGITINNPGVPCGVCDGSVSIWGFAYNTNICPTHQINTPCPGMSYYIYSVYFTNKGPTGLLPGTILQVQIDPSLSVQSSSSNCGLTQINTGDPNLVQYQVTGNNQIPVNGTCQIYVTVNNITIPPPPGLWLTNACIIANCPGGYTPSFCKTLQEGPDQCACDPNLKQVFPSGCGNSGFIANEELTYTIRFQNIGLGPAHNVVLRDTIDSDLDINSIQIISSSHVITSMQMSVSSRELTITFAGIELPPLIIDTAGSEGFVIYTINPNPGLPEGTVILNSTAIYFDSNPPVITEPVINTIVNNPIVVVDAGPDQLLFSGYSSNSCSNLTALVSGALPPYKVFWSTGDTTNSITVCPTETTTYSIFAEANGCISTPDSVNISVTDVHCGKNNDKVLVCHIPLGNPSKKHTLCIDQSDVVNHLSHGDNLGACISSSNRSGNFENEKESDFALVSEEDNMFNILYKKEGISIRFQPSQSEFAEIKAYDYSGKLVLSLLEKTVSKGEEHLFQINNQDFNKGIYLFTLQTPSKGIIVKKLVMPR